MSLFMRIALATALIFSAAYSTHIRTTTGAHPMNMSGNPAPTCGPSGC